MRGVLLSIGLEVVIHAVAASHQVHIPRGSSEGHCTLCLLSQKQTQRSREDLELLELSIVDHKLRSICCVLHGVL